MNISFHQVPSEMPDKKLGMRLILSIKRTGYLSNGGFFICDSHFDGSLFKKYLKIILLVLLCLIKFR